MFRYLTLSVFVSVMQDCKYKMCCFEPRVLILFRQNEHSGLKT